MIVQEAPSLIISLFGSFGHGVAWHGGWRKVNGNSKGLRGVIFDIACRGHCGTDLKLDDPFLGKAQVHALRVLQVEGTLVQLGNWVVGVQQGRLLVDFSNDLIGKQTETSR